VLRFESPLFSEADFQTIETALQDLRARAYEEAPAQAQQASEIVKNCGL
jgi:hypothetical protein